MNNDIRPLIENLDNRKAQRKESHYPTPGPITTDIMMKETQVVKSSKDTAKSYLDAIKEELKNGNIVK